MVGGKQHSEKLASSSTEKRGNKESRKMCLHPTKWSPTSRLTTEEGFPGMLSYRRRRLGLRRRGHTAAAAAAAAGAGLRSAAAAMRDARIRRKEVVAPGSVILEGCSSQAR